MANRPWSWPCRRTEPQAGSDVTSAARPSVLPGAASSQASGGDQAWRTAAGLDGQGAETSMGKVEKHVLGEHERAGRETAAGPAGGSGADLERR